MATQPLPYVTPEQYLEHERKAEFKSDYMSGEILCMAGASPGHVLISSNALVELRNRISDQTCGVYGSDLRVSLDPRQSYVYPDVTVVCGALEFVDERKDTVTNPKLVVEVLPASTRKEVLGVKLYWYLQVRSLSDVILVEQDNFRIDHWYRSSDGGWKNTVLEGADGVLEIASLDCRIPLAQIYLGADLPAAGQ